MISFLSFLATLRRDTPMVFQARRCFFPREVRRFLHWAKWCCVAVVYDMGYGCHIDEVGKNCFAGCFQRWDFLALIKEEDLHKRPDRLSPAFFRRAVRRATGSTMMIYGCMARVGGICSGQRSYIDIMEGGSGAENRRSSGTFLGGRGEIYGLFRSSRYCNCKDQRRFARVKVFRE